MTSNENTKIWQKTRVINSTDAITHDAAALVIEGGVGIHKQVKIGASGNNLTLSNTVLTAPDTYTISNTSNPLTIIGASTLNLTAASGDVSITSTGDINFVAGSNLINFGTKAQFDTNTNTLTGISSFDLTIASTDDDDIIFKPGTNGTVKIINGYTPLAVEDVATKGYVDSVVEGLDIKEAVRTRTTTLPLYTQTTPTVLIAQANGAIGTLGGVALSLDDRILVDKSSAQEDNGFYTVTDLGSGGTPWILTRTIDGNIVSELNPGSFSFVKEGTSAGNGYVITAPACVVLGTDPITFSQFSSAGVYAFTNLGAGQAIMAQSGNNINFYTLGATVTSGTAPLTVTSPSANVINYNLDLAKFATPLVIATTNGVDGITIKPGNFITTFSDFAATNTVSINASTRTISTTGGDLNISPSSSIVAIGTSNLLTFNSSSSAFQSITSSAIMELISAGGITLKPFTNILTLGVSPNALVFNSANKSITTGTGDLKILPSTGITVISILGEANRITVNTSTGTQTITATGALTIANGSGNIRFTPASGITEFNNDATPIQIDSVNGIINRFNSTVRLSTMSSGDVQVYPVSNKTIFSSVAATGNYIEINTPTSPQNITSSGALEIISTGNITVIPSTSITNFGAASAVSINTSAAPYTINATAAMTLSTTAGNIIISPVSNITRIGGIANYFDITTTGSLQTIASAGAMMLSSGSGNIAINPASNTTIFGGTISIITNSVPPKILSTAGLQLESAIGASISFVSGTNVVVCGTTPNVSIDYSSGTLTSSQALNVESTGGNINIKPGNNVTTLGSANQLTINTSSAPYTITGNAATTLLTSTDGIAINPFNNTTTFGTTMTINDLTNPTITATSGNMTLTSTSGSMTVNGTSIAVNTTAGNGNIVLTTNGTGQTIVKSGFTSPSTSFSTGTVYIEGTSTANTGGLGVNGSIYARESINAPTYANGSTPGNNVTIRGNTIDATGKVIIPTTIVKYGDSSASTKHIGIASGTKVYANAMPVTIFDVDIPASMSCYLNIEVVINDDNGGPSSTIYVYSSKILVNVNASNVVTYVSMFDAITDPTFSIDIATINHFKLIYDPTSTTSTATIWVQYMTTGITNGDITSITI